MFPEPASLEGFAVVDILVKFFAFDLPFELPFLVMVLVVGRLAVLFFEGNVVLEVVEVASVLVVVLLEVTPGLEVVRGKGGSVTIGWIIVENKVVVSSVRASTTSGSAIFVRPGVEVVNSSTFSLLPSSGVRVTKG